MGRLKVGVLTFHRCINYGSYWQARHLVEGLQARGCDATILDHDSTRVNVAEWKCAYEPLLPNRVPSSHRPLYRKKIGRFFRAFESLPLTRRFNIESPAEVNGFDVIVVGSDEVWNLFHPWYGKYPIFYGDGLQGARLVSYAASFGNYPANWDLDPGWVKSLQRFEYISVRDRNSQELITNTLGFEPQMVLDPCLQFDIPAQGEPPAGKRKYALVYGHSFSDDFIHKIREWSRSSGLPLVSVGYTNSWADETWIDAAPDDFACSFAQASAVVTNFFHGCVYSIKNKKPFVCETSPYRSHKIHGLLSKLGAENRLIQSGSQVPLRSLLSEPLEQTINTNLLKLREKSDQYLSSALRINNTN